MTAEREVVRLAGLGLGLLGWWGGGGRWAGACGGGEGAGDDCGGESVGG